VASTYGEGDPPDAAAAFAGQMQAASVAPGTAPALAGLQYAVLALGDSEYTQFCGFGHRLDDWLHAQGATPLFDRVDVDNGDPAAL
ncbi:flavodoxin domain-containing protein, partial [Achromobacter sp. AGC25]